LAWIEIMIFDWFSEFNVKGFTAVGEYFEGDPPDIPLTDLLALDARNLKASSQNLLEIDGLPENLEASMSELRWGIRAYFQFQDILSLPFTPGVASYNIFNRHYCYYESLVYLRESVVSWLDINVLAALTLLRPFLELSVLHLYWYLRCENEGYRPYYHWLKSDKDKGKPGFSKALADVFDWIPAKGWVEDRRIDELQRVIRNVYGALCAYNHTPKIHESIAAKGGGLGNVAYESFLFALHVINILLRQVVYLFILTYPMSIFPVEGYKKWGFSGPVGLFFDRCNFAILSTYMKSENIEPFKESLAFVPEVVSLTEWFDGFPMLTQDKIEAGWEEFRQKSATTRPEATHLVERLAISKAFDRALSWAVNYMMEPQADDDIPMQAAEHLMRRLKDW
jgi:hypothetical protein